VLLVELGSRRSHDHERDAFGAIRQVLQEGQHRRICPVQVLEYQHRGIVLGDQFQPAPPRREQLFALRRAGCADPQQGQQALAEPCSLIALWKDNVELGGGRGRVV
jgi:hypothetical protein